MVSLSFHGGVGEIGGNKVLLQEGGHSLFLDFGTPFNTKSRYYEEYLQPRPGMGLLDYLEMGLLPLLQGIYRTDLEIPNMWYHLQRHPELGAVDNLEGVVLSHAHLDHAGYISFLKAHIPVYSTALTAFTLKALQDSGRSDLEHQICYFSQRQLSTPQDWQQEALFSQSERLIQRPFRLGDINPEDLPARARDFWYSTPSGQRLPNDKRGPKEKLEPQELGSITAASLPLRCFPLDHSIPGACAWGVETSSGWIAYTGDIRFHGRQGHLSEEFVNKAAKLGPIALIGEGTYLERSTSVTESDVLENALRAAREATGLIIADFAPRDVERLSTFLSIAQEVGRKLVILPRDAYLLDTLNLLDQQIPHIDESQSLLIYQETTSATSPERWKRAIFARHPTKVVLAKEIQAHQDGYILCFSFLDLNELPSIHPVPGSRYIYSSSEAHSEEQEIDFRRLHNWLEHFQIQPFGLPREVGTRDWQIPPAEQGLHASGHASGPELRKMILEIHPQVFIPIHTDQRHYHHLKSALEGSHIQVYIPELGREIAL